MKRIMQPLDAAAPKAEALEFIARLIQMTGAPIEAIWIRPLGHDSSTFTGVCFGALPTLIGGKRPHYRLRWRALAKPMDCAGTRHAAGD